MTAIINTIWGGRISQIVDRQISCEWPGGLFQVVDEESNKVVIARTSNALVSIAYTGVASADRQWMDCNIANCLAHEELDLALIRPGSAYLGRPIHTVIDELKINLNGCLNSDRRSRVHDLKVTIVGWHLGRQYRPFAWELRREAPEPNGMRYFKLRMSSSRVGKFLRENPNGLWAESLGNPGASIDERIGALGQTEAMTHDDVEVYLRDAIRQRATETVTVGSDCIGVQLDPRRHDWHVQVTYYPRPDAPDVCPFLSPWVLTPRLICAPTASSSNFGQTSECGRYALGGFEDGITNLKVQTRVLFAHVQEGRGIALDPQPRVRVR